MFLKKRIIPKSIPAKIVFPVNFVLMTGVGSAGEILGIKIWTVRGKNESFACVREVSNPFVCYDRVCVCCFRLNSISFYDIASQGRVFMDTAD